MKKWWGISLVVLTILSGFISYLILHPTPTQINITLNSPVSKPLSAEQLGLKRAAIGYIDPNTADIKCRPLGQGENYATPQPTASLAKVITALVVLEQRPITANQSGPLITMTSTDEDRYWWAVNNNGSSVQVKAGEQYTERQLLEGILLASANNMADSLAIWSFGSLDNYRAVAQEWIKRHNLNSTIIGNDASGYDESTVSTPTDLCHIMLLATKNPTLVQIMSQTEAVMPNGEVIKNTNLLLGKHNIFAGKTGYNDGAGRGLMAAMKLKHGNKHLITAAVSLSHDSYNDAFSAVNNLAETLPIDLQAYHIRPGNQLAMARNHNRITKLVATKELLIPYWSDQIPQLTLVDTTKSNYLSKNSLAGNLMINSVLVNLLVQ